MKPLRLTALAAALFLGACSSPTPTDPAASGSRPSFDDGPGMAGSGDGVGTGGGTTTSDTGGTTTSTDSTGTQRGGGSLGSGN
jgi:hypothetical protein